MPTIVKALFRRKADKELDFNVKLENVHSVFFVSQHGHSLLLHRQSGASLPLGPVVGRPGLPLAERGGLGSSLHQRQLQPHGGDRQGPEGPGQVPPHAQPAAPVPGYVDVCILLFYEVFYCFYEAHLHRSIDNYVFSPLFQWPKSVMSMCFVHKHMQNADFGQILCRRASTKRHVT